MINLKDWNAEFNIEEFTHSNDLIKPSDINDKLDMNLESLKENTKSVVAKTVIAGAICGALYYGGAAVFRGGMTATTLGFGLHALKHNAMVLMTGVAAVTGAGLVISKMSDVIDKSSKVLGEFKKSTSVDKYYVVEDLPAYHRMKIVKDNVSFLREKYDTPTPEFKKELKELVEQEKLKVFLKEEGKYNFTMSGEKYTDEWNKDFKLETFVDKNDAILPSEIGKNLDKRVNKGFAPAGLALMATGTGLVAGIAGAIGSVGLSFDLLAKGINSTVSIGGLVTLIATTAVAWGVALGGIDYAKSFFKGENLLEKYKEKRPEKNLGKDNIIQEIDVPAFERMNAVIQKTAYIREKYAEPNDEYHKEMRNAIKEETNNLAKVKFNVKKFLEERADAHLEEPKIKGLKPI